MKIGFLSESILALGLILIVVTISLTCLNDSFSQQLRHSSENALNGYLYRVALRADQNDLTILDRFIIHSFAVSGAVLAYPIYPEASKALVYCIYGNGEPVEVSASYFRKSPFIKKEIERLGLGHFKEIGMHQADDWRTSLAFNPYNLHISPDSVEMYYPAVQFKNNPRIITQIPFGRFKIKFRDNLMAAIQGPPYKLWAKWERE